MHFLNENVWISIKISVKFILKGPINNIPALIQIMAWRRPGDKPLSESMMVRLPTHICVIRPQCVKSGSYMYLMSEPSHPQAQPGSDSRLQTWFPETKWDPQPPWHCSQEIPKPNHCHLLGNHCIRQLKTTKLIVTYWSQMAPVDSLVVRFKRKWLVINKWMFWF